MALATRSFGRGTRLVLAHGFTQNSHCWGAFGGDLGADHEVVAVDLPGHGDTTADHDDADLATVGQLLVESGGTGVYIGYSMGGRIALHAALQTPERLDALVLIGATAGIDDADARAARRQADEELAQRLLDLGLEAFLDRWLSNPLFAGLRPQAQQRQARLRNRPEGLASSLRHCGTGNQEPLWNRLAAFDKPVLVIAGDDDAKFMAVGHRLVDTLPRARLATAPSTHAVHLECPTTTAGLVRTFLDEHDLSS